ncbi:jg23642 [Pararge aegeria aegeria]|uniref:Jg23642 protein n=1 Tax=Pararge aegeria aegeria TaxID=348720 RepID=A0A8S4QPJ6_9NEOP|nr:jg23642 [Pararge aegeria aegeria]
MHSAHLGAINQKLNSRYTFSISEFSFSAGFTNFVERTSTRKLTEEFSWADQLLAPQCLKTKVYNECMTYGAETWTLTVDLIHQFKVAQRAMERAILGFSSG